MFMICMQHDYWEWTYLQILSLYLWLGIRGLLFYYFCIISYFVILAWTWGLSFVLDGPPFKFWCQTFSGGGSKVSGNFYFIIHFAQTAEGFSSAWSSVNLSGLCSCWCIDLSLWSCLAGFFEILLIPKVYLFSQGSKILRGTALRLWVMSWEIFSLNSCFFSDKEGLLSYFPWYLTG